MYLVQATMTAGFMNTYCGNYFNFNEFSNIFLCTLGTKKSLQPTCHLILFNTFQKVFFFFYNL